MTAPADAATLVELLRRRAEATPDATAFIWNETPYSFRWIDTRTAGFAARLRDAGVRPGDRVVLALPNGPAFYFAFHGVLRAGATAVPVYPGADPERWQTFARLAGARHLVLPPGTAFEADGIRVVSATSEDCGFAPPTAEPAPDDAAMIQFTSGSTADPKGVVLTHAALTTNVRQMIAGMEITAADVFVSWLPVYHDMGLILKTLAPIAVGASLVLLPTTLRSPGQWLGAIAAHRGTFTAAPDSAYRLAVRAVRESERYDLSSLRVALNAAEPVRAATIRAFEDSFDLDPVTAAGYGLAEATVGVSMMPPGAAPRLDAHGRVSSGLPFPGVRIESTGTPDAPDELIVHTPAATRGYFRNPVATEALFTEEGGIRTGDLGYVDADGYVFVVGRSKDVVIQSGRSLYAADVEELAEALPWVRKAAAVGIEARSGLGEQLVLFVEARRHRLPGAADLAADLVDRFFRRFGLRPGRVYVVRPKTIPLTPNGKKRRQELRRAFLGELSFRTDHMLYPPY